MAEPAQRPPATRGDRCGIGQSLAGDRAPPFAFMHDHRKAGGEPHRLGMGERAQFAPVAQHQPPVAHLPTPGHRRAPSRATAGTPATSRLAVRAEAKREGGRRLSCVPVSSRICAVKTIAYMHEFGKAGQARPCPDPVKPDGPRPPSRPVRKRPARPAELEDTLNARLLPSAVVAAGALASRRRG